MFLLSFLSFPLSCGPGDCPEGYLKDNNGNCIEVESDSDKETEVEDSEWLYLFVGEWQGHLLSELLVEEGGGLHSYSVALAIYNDYTFLYVTGVWNESHQYIAVCLLEGEYETNFDTVMVGVIY